MMIQADPLYDSFKAREDCEEQQDLEGGEDIKGSLEQGWFKVFRSCSSILA